MASNYTIPFLSLFAGVARGRKQAVLRKRQEKILEKNQGYSDQQKAQVSYLDKIISDDRSSPEEVSAAQSQLQGIIGLDMNLDYSQETQEAREQNKLTGQAEIDKVLQQVENLRKTGAYTDQQIKTSKALEDQRRNAINKSKGTNGKDSKKGLNDYLNQIDKSIDNARMLLRKKPNLDGKMVIDYDDPSNEKILNDIQKLEDARIETINKMNEETQINTEKKTIPWK